jgi:hypothetical protein
MADAAAPIYFRGPGALPGEREKTIAAPAFGAVGRRGVAEQPLTVRERISTGRAAQIVGVTSKTLLKLARDGKVPGAAELDEGLWRFDEARLRDWIRGKEELCAHPAPRRKISTKGAMSGGRESRLPGVTSVEAYRRLLGLKL